MFFKLRLNMVSLRKQEALDTNEDVLFGCVLSYSNCISCVMQWKFVTSAVWLLLRACCEQGPALGLACAHKHRNLHTCIIVIIPWTALFCLIQWEKKTYIYTVLKHQSLPTPVTLHIPDFCSLSGFFNSLVVYFLFSYCEISAYRQHIYMCIINSLRDRLVGWLVGFGPTCAFSN